MTTAQPEREGAVGEREHLEARHAGLQQILDARDARVRFGRGDRRDGSRHIALAHGPVANRDVTAAVTSDRKSTRLNSSHSQISYAVFCLKKKKDRFLSIPN